MTKKITKYGVTALLVLVLTAMLVGSALAFDSGENPGGIGPNTITWTGQGASNGVLDSEICPSKDIVPEGIDPDSYLHWIFTTDGGMADTDATLHLGGTGSGDYATSKDSGGAFHFFTPYFTPDSNLTASADFNVLETGKGAWNLTISHGCSGPKDYEELTVSKTVDTSYAREHFWSIAKSVDPKDIYLYIPGQGETKPSTGTATWTVDVTYDGYEDSDWYVSGDITVENTGTLDAIITSVDDVLAGSPIAVNCGVAFPYTLAVDATLTCSYGYDGYVEGTNEVTVTTERATYGPVSVGIVWGDPTTEVNKTVTIDDSVEGELGTVTAPNGAQFTYSKIFDWADYGDAACGDHTYNNTATIVETGASASAAVTVHVQCHVYETAYGKGPASICFIPTFSQWGWTNPLAGRGTTQTWNLYAGAAQCDTSKGTLVGTVTVMYDLDGYVTVTYNVGDPYNIKETHVYAGYTKFQKFGKSSTVAPGQYTNVGPFTGPIYVIAHAVVGIPDPNFTPASSQNYFAL